MNISLVSKRRGYTVTIVTMLTFPMKNSDANNP